MRCSLWLACETCGTGEVVMFWGGEVEYIKSITCSACGDKGNYIIMRVGEPYSAELSFGEGGPNEFCDP